MLRSPSSLSPPLNLSALYEQDYYAWLQATAKQLKDNQLQGLDRLNLLEEIESMGRSEKNALGSNLQILLMHLLKYRYQPEKRSNSWLLTIFEHRDRIEEALEQSPSLQPYLREIFHKCYAKARQKAALETGLALNTFPAESPFSLDETLDVDFLPETKSG
ncbi:DUF29 domain-containing protein [Synechocystis sp. LKSZ1]|uniref:DUF29 domain-containing protein n=1 Tax=Synechocystis sp. LKSZ1 TaxID=3144951 RepID=UPI00336C05E5